MDNLQDVPVFVRSSVDEEPSIELQTRRDDLIATYSYFREGVPDEFELPFSSDLIRTWDFVHSERAMYLYPLVADVFEYLGVGILSLAPMEHQQEWIGEMLSIYDKWGVVQDTGPLGSGKTFNQCIIAQLLELSMIVVCPANVMQVWEVMKVTVPGLIVLSYDALRGTRRGDGRRVLKHGLLERIDTTTYVKVKDRMEERQHVEFFATRKLRDLCEAGVIVVLDEVQHVKNLSIQQSACEKLVWAAMDSPNSLVSLLSGSPFDKPDHSVSLAKTLGYVRSSYLVRKEAGKGTVYDGLATLLAQCRRMNKPMTIATEKLARVTTAATARDLVWELYKSVIKPAIGGGSRAPVIDHTNTVSNKLFVLPKDDVERYTFGVGELKAALRYDENTGAVAAIDHSSMMPALSIMEGALAPSVAKDALWRLDTVPLSQVIIFCYFLPTYTLLSDIISPHHEVGIVNGEVSMKKRQAIISRFQSGELRVLIIGIKVGGEGLSLHDRLGGRERHSYIFPWWEAIAMYQCTRRGFRTGTMSDASCSFAHCVQTPSYKLIDAMHDKSETIRATLADKESYKVQLPGDYPYVMKVPGDEVEKKVDIRNMTTVV